MASPYPATVSVEILPDVTKLRDALDCLSRAFQDVADSLAMARDHCDDLLAKAEHEQAEGS